MANSVEKSIYDYLNNDSSFMADFTGVYWLESETTTYPYIVYWIVDDNGTKTQLNYFYQGEARIQFDLWDDSKIRGNELKNKLREKVEKLNQVQGGYHVMTVGTNEQNIQKEASVDPYHFVVDGVIRWKKI